MDLLKIDGQEGGLSTDLLGLIRELSGRLGNVQAAVDELRRHHLSGVASAVVTTAIGALGLDAEHIKTLFHEHAAVLGWLPRPLGELGEQRHHWPFRKAVAGSLPGPLSFGVAAGVDAGIETDVDGEILDGAVRFDKAQQLFVRVGVDATLEGDIGYSGPLGALSAQAAFKTGGAVTLANHFRHRRDETVFDALLADAGAFTLPGRATVIGLRSRVQVLPDGKFTIGDQYVHVHARGFVQVSGSLAWGRQVVRAAAVKVDSRDLDESLSVSAGLSASVRFSQLLSGDFDLLLSPAPAAAPWLGVTLAKSRKSKREAGFKVGAEAGVEGPCFCGRPCKGSGTSSTPHQLVREQRGAAASLSRVPRGPLAGAGGGGHPPGATRLGAKHLASGRGDALRRVPFEPRDVQRILLADGLGRRPRPPSVGGGPSRGRRPRVRVRMKEWSTRRERGR